MASKKKGTSRSQRTGGKTTGARNTGAKSPGAKSPGAKSAPAGQTRSEARIRAAGDAGGKLWIVLALAAVVAGIVLWQVIPSGRKVPEPMRIRVVDTHPHDRGAFTQGLLYHEGKLYESTGIHGQSSLREVDLETGEVLRRADLDPTLFGEGLARSGDRLVQLTWQSGRAIEWGLGDFEERRRWEYRGEGWGLCFDGDRFIMSDGSAWLSFRDPETFERVGEVEVTRAGRPLRRLNELECVDGEVFANVWMDDHIARIDPETGEVTAWIDASGLLDDSARDGTEDVLNGIAYVPETGRFLLTGKRWPTLFEVELVGE